jgi:hypothetical protein
MGFVSLQHLQEAEIHFTRALPARYGPPTGFGYPLDGLRSPHPGRPCFMPTALLGFTLRSFLLLGGTADVSAGVDPHTVSVTGIPAAKRWAGPVTRGFWAFTRPRVPDARRSVRAANVGCSLGFHPSRAYRRLTLPEISPRLLPHAFIAQACAVRPASRSLFRPSLGLARGIGMPTTHARQPS